MVAPSSPTIDCLSTLLIAFVVIANVAVMRRACAIETGYIASKARDRVILTLIRVSRARCAVKPAAGESFDLLRASCCASCLTSATPCCTWRPRPCPKLALAGLRKIQRLRSITAQVFMARRLHSGGIGRPCGGARRTELILRFLDWCVVNQTEARA
jgi:hypothetical protein